MWVLACYDVNTETKEGRRRLRRVAAICKDFGQRVQKSVFECQVDELHFEQLRRKLLKEIDPMLDNLRLYLMTEPHNKRVEEYGAVRTVLYFEDTLVIGNSREVGVSTKTLEVRTLGELDLYRFFQVRGADSASYGAVVRKNEL